MFALMNDPKPPPISGGSLPREQALLDNERHDVLLMAMHGGEGQISIKHFFRDADPSHRLILLLYEIPPGASEGLHSHADSQARIDEYYYVISGAGEMLLDGRRIALSPGDHVYSPAGVAHGVRNVSATEHLRVYVIALRAVDCPS